MTMKRRFLAPLLTVVLAGCSQIGLLPDEEKAPEKTPELSLAQTVFTDLPGWNGDVFAEALPAFVRSCDKIEKLPADKPFGVDERMGLASHWQDICKDARIIRPGNRVEAKYFFESRFVPYLAGDNHDRKGLFTGYYEPELQGRWSAEGTYNIPIYARPKDIVSIDLGKFRNELKGTQLAGRVENEELVPYYSRAEIEAGALRGKELEILWVNDPVEAFFLHIQGSGRVKLPDGSYVRIGYAGRNGRRYTSLGRELVAMGEMKLDDVTAPAIRQWLHARPAYAQQLMNKNESYVFFRVIEGDGPIGAQGVALTPGRSLAVDRAFVPMGVPMWLDTTDPTADDAPLQRLVIAQDTGSAIKGPVRGDVFWGFGPDAALRAGLMKQPGAYYLLLPRAVARPVG